jgi:hypothetical protein
LRAPRSTSTTASSTSGHERRRYKKRVVVITHSANATVHHIPTTLRLSLAGLRSGLHALTVRLAYNKHASKPRHHHVVTVTKTLRARFTVC